MKKFITSMAAVMTALSMTASATVMEFKINDTALNVQADDGNITSQTLEVAPYTVNDRTVVPVRVISETFGADVAWDEATETVTITKGDKVIKLVIGKTTATVNGEEVTLDVAPFTENDRTLLPVRFVSEVLGYSVDYVEYNEGILITDEAPAMVIDGVAVSRATYKMLYDEVMASGYTTPEYACDTIENLFVCIYAFTEETAMTDDIKIQLADSVNYADYVEYVGLAPLETIYTQLMVKNTIADATIDELSKEMKDPTDEAIQKRYEETYVTSKHILISTVDNETGEPLSDADIKKAEKLAKDIKKRIDKGEDFDKLMEEYSQDPGSAYYPEGYTFTYNEMVPEFEEASFALEVGKVSDPVLSTFGYHIIKREPIAPITDEVKEVIEYQEINAAMQLMMQLKTATAEVVKNQEVIDSIIGK